MNIEEVSYEELQPAEWRVTHTLKPDLRLVSDSALVHGWLTPLVVKSDGKIIDGFHRWWLSHKYRPIQRKLKGVLPVTRVDVDEVDAMILHVQLNRGHGLVLPKHLSVLVNDVRRSRKYDDEEVRKQLRMGVDEWGLLTESSTLLKQRKINEYDYGPAWIPVTGEKSEYIEMERPPNADR